MIKYYQMEGAFKLYEEALDKGYILSLGAYNSVLKCANFIKEDWSERWKFTEVILNTIRVIVAFLFLKSKY